jgi:hypothetical protein
MPVADKPRVGGKTPSDVAMSNLPPQHAEKLPPDRWDACHSSQSVWVEGCHTIRGLSEDPFRLVYDGIGISLPVLDRKLLHPEETEMLASAWLEGTL